METDKKEIDIIIENWLLKIAEDKINEAIDNINFDSIAEKTIREKYIGQLSTIKLPKLVDKMSVKEFLDYISRGSSRYDSYFESPELILSKTLEKWLEKFLSEQLRISWDEGNFFKKENLDVKDTILKNVKENSRFTKFFIDFFNKK